MSDEVKDLARMLKAVAGSADASMSARAARFLTAQQQEIERLREALVAEREENLWNAFNAGIIRPDGKWITGGMSDAEWLMLQCGASLKVPQDPEAIKRMIPIAARAALTGKEGE